MYLDTLNSLVIDMMASFLKIIVFFTRCNSSMQCWILRDVIKHPAGNQWRQGVNKLTCVKHRQLVSRRHHLRLFERDFPRHVNVKQVNLFRHSQQPALLLSVKLSVPTAFAHQPSRPRHCQTRVHFIWWAHCTMTARCYQWRSVVDVTLAKQWSTNWDEIWRVCPVKVTLCDSGSDSPKFGVCKTFGFLRNAAHPCY